MFLSIKKFIIDYFYNINKKIKVDTDFYESDFYLRDMED